MMADETRLRCLLLLSRSEPLCVQQLVEALDESQPKVSRHLAQMRTMGVLSTRREGQWVYYSVSKELSGWMTKVISNLGQSNCLKQEYQEDIKRLSSSSGTPCC
ncbi:metalloregulator ArsR/SmtB family transcription factor [Endozoicomonas montiporae]|nr:metalloregulator ArsR/SmtB family transcription factor [Endozoicomonas montiporae]